MVLSCLCSCSGELYRRKIMTSLSPLCRLTLKTCTNQVFQIRNHTKMYPWRHNRSNRYSYLDNTQTPYTDRANINEFMNDKKKKKPWMKVIPKDKDSRYNSYVWNDSYKSDPVDAKKTSKTKFERFKRSLIDRGFAREAIPYEPLEGIQERVVDICRACLTDSDLVDNQIDQTISNDQILCLNLNEHREIKFKVIERCIEEFKHDLPSSCLTDMERVGDLVEYYMTPVRGLDSYSALVRKENSLPPNLTVLSEPQRFNKETDEFFQGYTALPGTISKVSGLRAAKKYPVLNQDEFQWPDI